MMPEPPGPLGASVNSDSASASNSAAGSEWVAKRGALSGETTLPNEMVRSKRRQWMQRAAAVSAGAAGLGWAWWRERPSNLPIGSALPGLAELWAAEFDTPGGQKLAAARFKGRPLLINFWATWCPPCVEELPLIEAFYRQNGSKGWQVLGIAADKADSVVNFLTKLPLSFPIAIAGLEGVALSRSLGNLAGGLPFTVVVGRDGQVIQRKMGQIQPEDLRNWAALR